MNDLFMTNLNFEKSLVHLMGAMWTFVCLMAEVLMSTKVNAIV